MRVPFVLFVVVVLALSVAGGVRSCQEQPWIDQGMTVLRGGVER